MYDRTKELLGESDRGIVLFRHVLENQIKLVESGKDPMNVFRDPAKNIRQELPTESREKFLTGRLGARMRYSERFKALKNRLDHWDEQQFKTFQSFKLFKRPDSESFTAEAQESAE